MFQDRECLPLQNHYTTMTRERAAGIPRYNPTLNQVLSVRRSLVFVSQGFITWDSLAKSVSGGWQQYAGPRFPPIFSILQQQVTLRFLQTKTGSTSITPGHKVLLIRSLWLGLGTAATWQVMQVKVNWSQHQLSPQFIALHTTDKEQS